MKDSVANSPSTNSTDNLALQIVRVACNLCDVPISTADLIVCGHKVSDQEQDRHHDVLGDRDDIRAGYFCDSDLVFVGGVEIDVAKVSQALDLSTYSDPIPAVTQSLSFLAFSKSSAVRYPGWKGVVMRISVCRQSTATHLTYIMNLLLENRVWSLLVIGDNVFVTIFLGPLLNAELVFDGTKQTRLFFGG